jgi:hypothetical protein
VDNFGENGFDGPGSSCVLGSLGFAVVSTAPEILLQSTNCVRNTLTPAQRQIVHEVLRNHPLALHLVAPPIGAQNSRA